MIGNWLLYLGGLAGALVFHIFYFGWYSWFVLLLVLCLPWFSLLVSLSAMVQARLQIKGPKTCLKGQQAAVKLKAAGGFFAMPACRLRLEVRDPLTGSRKVIKRKIRGKNSRKLPLDTAHCGLLQCSAKGSRVYDYLGLFGFPIRGSGTLEVLVEPVPTPPRQLPNLTQFLSRSRRPKPGGGFSEEHELRDYRPGDSLRDIHWKLSAKTDTLILREAQEPLRERILLTFDLQKPGDGLDVVLAQLLWLSNWLLEHDTPHQILWIDPQDCELVTCRVQAKEDLPPLLRRALSSPLKADVPSVAERRFSDASWRYHVVPEQEVQP